MKLLVVDDSKLLQGRLLKNIMRIEKNINLQQAFNCKEARELFSAINPDFVILDLDLPDGSGCDLLQKFKHEGPGAEVAIFTNYPTNEFKGKCIQLGADHFIDKSNLTELINILLYFSDKYNV
jgi:DNA-binding response OmpR family regulator